MLLLQSRVTHTPSWMFLIQREVVDPLRIFSKYTPENPLVRHARTTTNKPCNMVELNFTYDTSSVAPSVEDSYKEGSECL